jgi:uncharacterized protein (DUF2062 family)
VATIAREREALWDVVGTLVIAAILALILQTNLALTVLGFFLLGCLAHIVFCVRTTVTGIMLPSGDGW